MRGGPLLIVLGMLTAPVAAAEAGWPERVGTRALGMGGALRGAATGDAGPMLNPSGMALARAYAVEAAYELSSEISAHRPHLSIVDSTSAFGIAGGLYYTYLNARPGTDKLSGHEAGLSLSVPFGQRFFLGVQGKYFRLTTGSTLEEDRPREQTIGAFTIDVGATVRPIDVLTLGMVGYNLAEIQSAFAARAVGGGLALQPLPGLLVTADATITFNSYTSAGDNVKSYMGGGEYSFPQGFALRAGGGKNGIRDAAYVTGGASAISEVGAIDLGVSRDVSGDAKLTVFAISIRLFASTPAGT